MELKEIKEHLRLHALWLAGEPGGKRADLSYADLSNANLSYADLSNADLSNANLVKTLLENKVILTFQFNKHTAYYLGNDIIQIGCKKFPIKHWLENFEQIGKESGYTEDEISKYGRFIKGCANIQKDLK